MAHTELARPGGEAVQEMLASGFCKSQWLPLQSLRPGFLGRQEDSLQQAVECLVNFEFDGNWFDLEPWLARVSRDRW